MGAVLSQNGLTTPLDRVPVVQTEGLGKAYRTGFWLNQRVTSLQQCSLTVYQGETFGLLGPNGAGKTTLLKILLGIIRPTAGKATLLGHALGDSAVKQRIGYLPENAYFYDFLTGWEFLQYTAGLFGLSRAAQQRRIVELLDLVGLPQEAAKKKQLRQYSKGMLQRVGMAQALMNDPDVVFLDEPMSGLDPTGRFQVREIILALKREGKTIFFNSHILSDVEVICDRIAILDQGELIASGSLDQLLGTADQYVAKGRGGRIAELEFWLDQMTVQGDLWQGHVKGDPYEFAKQIPLVGGHLIALQQTRPTLEEFFIAQIRQRRGG
ncbi:MULTISPECIES: ABC transporter ATP-binding protein [Cyanophyceae]|uniref:ABC transporter ATP-binding protein n=1 Tax=Cyanophyceae TaxID=3028117 RepID=UPI001687F5CC|nr:MULTISPECIES: ABC transporter ATP-binding protein [Cyanophyceae]MBD1917220.1 ABC transporter ATP-binding protein [Phormidium sp. FACHB-77]MBD2030751.1 ABC transporter ATP-binding protein [Phormidium sp. FACHB-322]MBD2050141.1 ABC transporter ATP-binding protein [Leptolyngbya sp. FACHB-60]